MSAPRSPSRRRRPDPEEALIDARIAAGEDPEAFLCLECFCWMIEPGPVCSTLPKE